MGTSLGVDRTRWPHTDRRNHDEGEGQYKGDHHDIHHREEEGMARQKEDERRREVESGSCGRGNSNRRDEVAEIGGGNLHGDYSREVEGRHDGGSSHRQEGNHDGRGVVSENGSGRCEGFHLVAEWINIDNINKAGDAIHQPHSGRWSL